MTVDPLDVVKKLRDGNDFQYVGYEFDRGTPQNDGLDRHWIKVKRWVGGRRSGRSFCFTDAALSLRMSPEQALTFLTRQIYRECRDEMQYRDEAAAAPSSLDLRL